MLLRKISMISEEVKRCIFICVPVIFIAGGHNSNLWWGEHEVKKGGRGLSKIYFIYEALIYLGFRDKTVHHPTQWSDQQF